MSQDPLRELALWAQPLLAKLQPGERRKLARAIGVDLARSQRRRIAEQRNPDGSAYEKRKTQPARAKAGRIRRRAMFAKLRTAKRMRVQVDAHQVTVGYAGRDAQIARVHQEGLEDAVRPGGVRVRYPRRELLGFDENDVEHIRDQLLAHLGGA